MRRALSLLIALAVCAMPMASAVQAQAGKTLDIYYIDTEGGQATLFLSPTGETLLVDAGNAGERDLNRILEVLKLAGVKQIDHFWLTHYHGDHYGSLIDIAKQVPIKHLYDHGPSIEGDRPNIIKFQAAYADFYKSIPRTIVKPGDKLAFAGTDTTAVMSDSVPLKTPVAKAPGAGRPNPLCAAHKPRDESKVDPDNHHSAGFVMNYGRFRTIDLGDLTWSREFMLMCPNNPDRHRRSLSDESSRPRSVRRSCVRARHSAARGDHEQRHAQGRRGADVRDARDLAQASKMCGSSTGRMQAASSTTLRV